MTKATKHISRTQYGWQVRIKIPTNGMVTQAFSDTAHGTSAKSLRAAKLYRDAKLKEHGIPLTDGRYTPPRENSSQTSTGIIGVTFRNNTWKAQYHDKGIGHAHNRSFSCLKHGECEAFELACEYRYKHCGKLKVYRGHDFPCDISVPFEYVD